MVRIVSRTDALTDPTDFDVQPFAAKLAAYSRP